MFNLNKRKRPQFEIYREPAEQEVMLRCQDPGQTNSIYGAERLDTHFPDPWRLQESARQTPPYSVRFMMGVPPSDL